MAACAAVDGERQIIDVCCAHRGVADIRCVTSFAVNDDLEAKR